MRTDQTQTREGSDISQRIESGDLSLFSYVLSQSTDNDKKSFLALQSAFRQRKDFVYLEIGSYRGGSLQPYTVDPKCREIISIDPRPYSLPDERGEISYFQNSTRGMLDALAKVPGANLGKIKTVEEGTSTLRSESLGIRPDLCFIDGEHTDNAVLTDALFCLEIVQNDGCIAFHDANIVYNGIQRFIHELKQKGRTFRTFFLPDSILFIELDGCRVSESTAVQKMQLSNCEGYLWGLRENDVYRRYFNSPPQRLLRFCKRKTWDTGPVGRLRTMLRGKKN